MVLGLRPGDHLALLAENRLEWPVVQAAVLMGAVLVPLNTHYRCGDLSFVLKQSRARATVLSPRFRSNDYLDHVQTLRGAVAQVDRPMLGKTREEQLYYRCKAGRPLPLVDICIVDESMNSLAHDGETTGEVVVRAPWLTQGYLKNPESSATLWRGGYLHTGDIGHIDAEGYLKVTDRLKDVIKSGGEWVSSILLEDLVSQLPQVSEVAAIGIPDDKWGERPMLLVVARDGETIDSKDVVAHLKRFVQQGVIEKWAVPDRPRSWRPSTRPASARVTRKNSDPALAVSKALCRSPLAGE